MDPFVRRLVQRLCADPHPLSRNRHFHTFESAEGREALKISRRIKALGKDILSCQQEGHPAKVTRQVDSEGRCLIELRLERVRGRRVSTLAESELELLSELPGIGEALGEPSPTPQDGDQARAAAAGGSLAPMASG